MCHLQLGKIDMVLEIQQKVKKFLVQCLVQISIYSSSLISSYSQKLSACLYSANYGITVIFKLKVFYSQ